MKVQNRSGYVNDNGLKSGQYHTAKELKLGYDRAYGDKRLETTLTLGKDVFGENYTWLAVNVYW